MTTNIFPCASSYCCCSDFSGRGDAQDGLSDTAGAVVGPVPGGDTTGLPGEDRVAELAESWGVPVIGEVRDGVVVRSCETVVRAIQTVYTLLFTNDPGRSRLHRSYPRPLTIAKGPLANRGRSQGTSVLVMPSLRGRKLIKELIAMAKARPGALTFASAGDASASVCVGSYQSGGGS